jgi:LysM repeat protein
LAVTPSADIVDTASGIADFGRDMIAAKKALANVGNMKRSLSSLSNKSRSQISTYFGKGDTIFASLIKDTAKNILQNSINSIQKYAQEGNKSTSVNPQNPTTQKSPIQTSGNNGGSTGNQSQNTGVTSRPGTITIQRGDTLAKLAQQYKTDVATLMRLNPQITNANRINAGDKLNVPAKP